MALGPALGGARRSAMGRFLYAGPRQVVPWRPAPEKEVSAVVRRAQAVTGGLAATPNAKAAGQRPRHARRSPSRSRSVAAGVSRRLWAVVIAGGGLSLGVGLVLGGALTGVDVALAPPGHSGPSPVIAMGPSGGSSSSASRPAHNAAGANSQAASSATPSPASSPSGATPVNAASHPSTGSSAPAPSTGSGGSGGSKSGGGSGGSGSQPGGLGSPLPPGPSGPSIPAPSPSPTVPITPPGVG